jgi:hypothetical protein
MSLQDQLNARGQIVLDPIYYDLTEPLVIRAGCHVDGSKGAIIHTHYVGPAFVTPTDQEASHFSIRHLRMEGGGIQLNASTDTGAAISPSFFLFEDLTIVGAACAYDAGSSGAWMGTLRSVHAYSGVDGYKQLNGTTMTFENCFAAWSSGKGWWLYSLYSSVMNACAMDHHAQQAAYFGACRGLSINGFYMEANATDGSPIVLFDGCDGLAINGWYTLGSLLRAAPGLTSYLMQINASAGVVNGLSAGGSPRPNPDVSSGGGNTVVLWQSGSVLARAGCTLVPANPSDGPIGTALVVT